MPGSLLVINSNKNRAERNPYGKKLGNPVFDRRDSFVVSYISRHIVIHSFSLLFPLEVESDCGWS
jgi:hypothetical protein